MAKKRKKAMLQRRRYPPPPLSKRDRCFYYVAFFLILAAWFAGTFLRASFRERLGFSGGNILAVSITGSAVLGEVSHCVLALTLFLYFLIALSTCRPVFDRKKGYAGNPVYHTIARPLFAPNPKPTRLTHWGRILLVSWVTLWLLLSGLSYFGRVAVDDSGNIHTYNAWNQEETEYAPYVTELCLSVKHYMPNNSFTWRYYPVLTLHTRSGESYSFQYSEFAGERITQKLESMLALKAIFPKQYFTIKEGALARIYDIRDSNNLSREDYLLLCELFGMEEHYEWSEGG